MAGDDSTILVDGPGNRIAAEAIEGSIDIASGNIRFEYEGADQVNFRTTGISVDGAAGPRLLYRSQRGTLAAPQPVQGGTSGDTMLDARGEGYVGPTNLYKTAGIIRISTDLDATVSLSLIHISEPTRPY